MISTYTSKLKQLQIGDLIAKIPIIQGGMGVGISRSHLAGAVSVSFLLRRSATMKKASRMIRQAVT